MKKGVARVKLNRKQYKIRLNFVLFADASSAIQTQYRLSFLFGAPLTLAAGVRHIHPRLRYLFGAKACFFTAARSLSGGRTRVRAKKHALSSENLSVIAVCFDYKLLYLCIAYLYKHAFFLKNPTALLPYSHIVTLIRIVALYFVTYCNKNNMFQL